MKKHETGARAEKPEKVKFFLDSYHSELEEEYNNWMVQNRGRIVVVDRQLTAVPTSHPGKLFSVIAVFYWEK